MTDKREERGRRIATQNDQIRRIDDYHYEVKSQSSEKWYDVIGIESGFSCNCPDHTFRSICCKHIHSVEFSIKLRESVEKQIIINPVNVECCPKCQSNEIKKIGIRHNKHYDIQMYRCKLCDKKFSNNLGFERLKATPEAVTASLNLYFNGESLRHVANSMKLFGVSVTHKTVENWIKKYVKLMEKYLAEITPQVSDKWYCDEIYLKIKGDRKYLYAMLDGDTRYWIASQVADTKYTEDVRPLFKKSVEVTGKKPKVLLSDGARNFMQAHKKEWYSRYKEDSVQHIRHIHFKNDRNTNKMERLNGEIRDREKVMRGLKKDDSAILRGIQLHHNFIRPHSSLDGMTPADKAGIIVNGNNKWITLIQNAQRESST